MSFGQVVVSSNDNCYTIVEVPICRPQMVTQTCSNIVGLSDISHDTFRPIRIGTRQHINACT